MISLFAASASASAPNLVKTYGYNRYAALGIMMSTCLVWGLLTWLAVVAVKRIINPTEIKSEIMAWASVFGFAVNFIGLFTIKYYGKTKLPNGE